MEEHVHVWQQSCTQYFQNTPFPKSWVLYSYLWSSAEICFLNTSFSIKRKKFYFRQCYPQKNDSVQKWFWLASMQVMCILCKKRLACSVKIVPSGLFLNGWDQTIIVWTSCSEHLVHGLADHYKVLTVSCHAFHLNQ